jgi:hypothetical protein
MEDAGQRRAKKPYVAQATIKIKGGKPCPENVYVLHSAVVRFTNEDPQDYVIRLFAQGHTVAPDVDMFLPSFESRTLVAGLDLEPDAHRVCDYDVIPTEATSIADGADYETPLLAFKAVMRDAISGSGGSGTVHVGGN